MNILERYHAMEYGPAPEARNEADAWLAGRDFSKALFIDGAWKAAADSRSARATTATFCMTKRAMKAASCLREPRRTS